MKKFTPAPIAIVHLKHLSRDYYSLRLGPWKRAQSCRPGQFVHVRMPDSEVYFRRAMSIAAVDPKRQEIEIIFKVFGRGTRILAQRRAGRQARRCGRSDKIHHL